MKLSQITAKPQLIEIIIDDEETVNEYGEALSFYTWDRQPMDIFLKLANIETGASTNVIDIVRTLILDENGKEILAGDKTLPAKLLMKSIAKVTELLGK
jgi:hypothetical protein